MVAPQHPFPAPVEHAHAVTQWVAEHGDRHGWDGSRLAVGGQSAGGGLAAAVARLAFEGRGPAIGLQVLHYPPLDLSIPTRKKHSALRRPVIKPWMGEVFDTAYVPDRAMRADPLVSPAGAADTADLTGMTPALVITAEFDTLRDEGVRYADRLREAGALIEHRELAGVDHGYDGKDDALALETYRFIGAHVRRELAHPAEAPPQEA